MTDECPELKNIKYKSMLLSGPSTDNTKENVTSLTRIMEKDMEKQQNTKLPWTKLDTSVKQTKLIAFADYYARNNSLSASESRLLKKVLKEGLERKILTRAGVVTYDKAKELISNINNLVFNKQARSFTLRDMSKRTATSKSLAPKRPHRTRKVDQKQDGSVASKKEKIDIS